MRRNAQRRVPAEIGSVRLLIRRKGPSVSIQLPGIAAGRLQVDLPGESNSY